ncbi:MAG TPA: GGDEF domain-containing protein [Acidimicrobiales bacterium]|nr:GGDEF domain-containing protein [Acidimicrobiales bacterium]
MDMATASGASLAAVTMQLEAEDLAAAWRELCHWDPMLPPGTEPPMAARMVRAVADGLSRPQPLGWGPDPVVEGVTEGFVVAVGSLELAVGELVCLRETIRRRLEQLLLMDERQESMDRLTMLIDRAIVMAASHAARQLEHEAMVDPLTGLLNRRALERDLRREFARAERYGTPVGLMMVDADGLKLVNDSEGHLAGDSLLRSLATALTDVLRTADTAYRVGGDEFVVVLPGADRDVAELVAARVLGAGAPLFSWGVATYPDEAGSVETLIDLADRRLFEQRRAHGRGRTFAPAPADGLGKD